ncbi:hypothetical protein PQX77_011727 [Marasmius sp. AFHP31]|nr:hypothetical protein PQX77_011727 [Marasmius sp. AFHP31]
MIFISDWLPRPSRYLLTLAEVSLLLLITAAHTDWRTLIAQMDSFSTEKCRVHELSVDESLPNLASVVDQAELGVDTIEHTRTKRAVLHETREKYETRREWPTRNSISPFTKLPPEIWTLIFIELCRSEFSLRIFQGEGGDGTRIVANANSLSSVCRQWREIAIDCPNVWSYISLDIHSIRVNIQGLLSFYLEHSRDHPLTVQIKRTRPSTGRQNNVYVFNALVQLLITNNQQIEELDVQYTSQFLGLYTPSSHLGLCATYSSGGEKDFPCLRRLRARWDSRFTWDDTPPSLFLRYMGVASALTEAHVSDLQLASFTDTAFTLSLPYRQLTALVIDSVKDVRPLLRVLPECKQLATLDILDLSGMPATNIPSPSFRIPVLRKFELATSSLGQFIASLLDPISVPSLHDLNLSFRTDHSTYPGRFQWPWSSILGMLQRSACPLQALTLNVDTALFPVDPSMFTDISRACPSITRLRLSIGGLEENILEEAARILTDLTVGVSAESEPKANSTVVPRMTSFELQLELREPSSAVEPLNAVVERFLQMLESRATEPSLRSTLNILGSGEASPAPVYASLRIPMEIGLEPSVIDRLRRLTGQGTGRYDIDRQWRPEDTRHR